jgi:hypothetical protein
LYDKILSDMTHRTVGVEVPSTYRASENLCEQCKRMLDARKSRLGLIVNKSIMVECVTALGANLIH